MKQITVVLICLLVGWLAWLLVSHLSSDALAMGTGVAFGVLMYVLAARDMQDRQRRQERQDYDEAPVHVTYNVTHDNRHLTITPAPAMPLIADRMRQIQQDDEYETGYYYDVTPQALPVALPALPPPRELARR